MAENLNTTSPTNAVSKESKYVLFCLKWGMLILGIGAFFPLTKSAYEMVSFELPTISQLQMTKGTVESITPYERVNKNVSQPKLAVLSEATMRTYRCAFTGDLDSCLPNASNLIGKTLTIGWYNTANDNPVMARHIYTLESDGKHIVTYEQTVHNFRHVQIITVISAVVPILFVLLVLFFPIDKFLPKNKHISS